MDHDRRRIALARQVFAHIRRGTTTVGYPTASRPYRLRRDHRRCRGDHRQHGFVLGWQNQAHHDNGGVDVLDGFQANPTSLTGTAAILHDLAAQLQAGQVDLFLLDWAGAPASHPDIARAMRSFTEFAHDQHQDVVALLVALSTRVKAAADSYQHTDEAVAAAMTTFLTESTFQPADKRPD